MSNNKKSSVGIVVELQAVFIILKILGVINWSWGVVFIPIFFDLGTYIITSIAIEVLKFIQKKDLKMTKKAKRITKKKEKTYYKGNSNKENKAILEKYKNDTLPVQSMVLEGASEQDIIQLKSSKEYKTQEARNKTNYNSEITDIVDYINMNASMSDNERKKLLLKLKKAYISNKPTLAPIKYAENVADSHHKEKKLGTR